MIDMNQREHFRSAVSMLRKELSPDSAKIIRFSLEQNHSYETFLQRVGFGIAIRNLLAKNGILWEDAALCSIWLEILKESIKVFPGIHSASNDWNESMN
jgi:hypothetical protein